MPGTNVHTTGANVSCEVRLHACAMEFNSLQHMCMDPIRCNLRDRCDVSVHAAPLASQCRQRDACSALHDVHAHGPAMYVHVR